MPEVNIALANIAGLRLIETAPPATPATGYGVLFMGTDKKIKIKDSLGNISGAIVPTIVQVANYQTSTYASGTTTIPNDTSIPQITEGTEFMTLAFTPGAATSYLDIDIQANLISATAAVRWIIGALFQDSVANAISANVLYAPAASTGGILTIKHRMLAGTTSPITFRFRAGVHNTGTIYFNGTTSATLGGTIYSSITVTEVTV